MTRLTATEFVDALYSQQSIEHLLRRRIQRQDRRALNALEALSNRAGIERDNRQPGGQRGRQREVVSLGHHGQKQDAVGTLSRQQVG